MQKTYHIKIEGQHSELCFVETLEDAMAILENASLFLLDRAASNYPVLRRQPHLIMTGGEPVKSQHGLKEIIDACFSSKLRRSSTLAVVGGGALCDTAAFAASIFMRGISFILVPSTILAMVDAAIGGKTAINFHYYKNMLGVFSLPEKVLLCPAFLHTLPERQFLSGFAEVLKAGMLDDDSLLKILEDLTESMLRTGENICAVCLKAENAGALSELIERAVLVKQRVVERDFKEQNARRFLNLGHTFAHAIESNARQCGINFLHGEAVGLGIRSSLNLGMQLGITDGTYAQRIFALLDALAFPRVYTGLTMDVLLNAMKVDKKNDSVGVNFVLQQGQGKTEMQRVDLSLVKTVLTSMGCK